MWTAGSAVDRARVPRIIRGSVDERPEALAARMGVQGLPHLSLQIPLLIVEAPAARETQHSIALGMLFTPAVDF